MARPRIVIVGAGFAGYHAARTQSRLSRGHADIALVNPMDYFLYLPLLPEVAAGVIDPRRLAVSLPATLVPCRYSCCGVDLGVRVRVKLLACIR
jgi:NADH dehydrogenase